MADKKPNIFSLWDAENGISFSRKDGGPGSGNFGHTGRSGEVGGSAPSGSGPMKGLGSRKSPLSQSKRADYSQKVSDLRRRLFEEYRIQKGINPKVKDYDPTPFRESEKRCDEVKKEAKSLVDEMPTGTIITKGVDVFEKNEDGTWTERSPQLTKAKELKISADYMAHHIVGVIEDEDYPPVVFPESTDDAKQIAPVKTKSAETYQDWATDLATKERKDLVKRAKKDPEFKELVDNIVYYTEGGYKQQRQVAEKLVQNGPEEASAVTIGELANGSLYVTRDLWKGQGLKSSESSVASGMASVVGVINESEPTSGRLFRVTSDSSIAKKDADNPYTIPKVGDKIRMDAPVSFTASQEVEAEISKQKYGDVIHYVLEPGAHAVGVAALSRHKQEEYLSCGEFEVVSVEHKSKGYPISGEPTKAMVKRGVKESDNGLSYVDVYEVTVTIRQIGKAEFGSRSDDDTVYLACSGHFDDRMVIEENQKQNVIPEIAHNTLESKAKRIKELAAKLRKEFVDRDGQGGTIKALSPSGREDDEGKWITVNGTHIYVGEEGSVQKGPGTLKSEKFGNAKSSQSNNGGSESSSGAKSPERNAPTTPHVRLSSPSSKQFKSSFMAARETQPAERRWRVSADYEEGDYEHMSRFRTPGGSTFAIHDGDIVSVCKHTSDSIRGKQLMAEAVAKGGKKLDSFSGNHGFYVSCGFEPISWCAFDEHYAPEGWDKKRDKKEPVIFYKYTGNTGGSRNVDDFLSSVPASADYDAAQKARDDSM